MWTGQDSHKPIRSSDIPSLAPDQSFGHIRGEAPLSPWIQDAARSRRRCHEEGPLHPESPLTVVPSTGLVTRRKYGTVLLQVAK